MGEKRGYKHLTQIKPPKKNKGRKHLKATASIFFFSTPSLSLSGGVKIGACGGGRLRGERFRCLGRELQLPVTPAEDASRQQPLLVAV